MSGQQKITYQLRKSKAKHYGPTKAVKGSKQKADLPQAIPKKENDDVLQLKQFDLETKYGPGLGMTRLERWDRAFELGLNPPEHIKDLIQSHMDDPQYAHPLWNSYSLLS